MDPYFLWRAICQIICLHKIALSTFFCKLPTFSPCSYSYSASICFGSDSCHFTNPCLCSPLLCWIKWEKEKRRTHWEFQMLLLCSIYGRSDISLSSAFLPLSTDGSYHTVWKYCGYVFTDFYSLWSLWPDDHLEDVVVLNSERLCQFSE